MNELQVYMMWADIWTASADAEAVRALRCSYGEFRAYPYGWLRKAAAADTAAARKADKALREKGFVIGHGAVRAVVF